MAIRSGSVTIPTASAGGFVIGPFRSGAALRGVRLAVTGPPVLLLNDGLFARFRPVFDFLPVGSPFDDAFDPAWLMPAFTILPRGTSFVYLGVQFQRWTWLESAFFSVLGVDSTITLCSDCGFGRELPRRRGRGSTRVV